MEIGLVGLGKMGGNMRTRLRNAGHTVVGYDRNPDVSDVESLEKLVAQLPSPKVVWVMVPSGDATRETVRTLGDLLGEGDLVVDGGNSRWTDDQVNADLLAAQGVGFVDCGVSGGVWGLENGYALMCGGSEEDVAKVQPALDALKPEGESGFVHAGKAPGAGHFAKMVHNGIEYAMMQAYAEGFELLEKVDLVENVVDVFDVHHLPDGTPYFVGEFVEGEELATYVQRRGAFEPRMAAARQKYAARGVRFVGLAVSVNQSPELKGALQELTQKRATYRAFQQQYTDEYRPMREAKADIQTLEHDIRRLLPKRRAQ